MKSRGENLPDETIVAVTVDVNALRNMSQLAERRYREIQEVSYAIADLVGVERGKSPFNDAREEVWEVSTFLRELLRRAEAIQQAQRTPISI